MILLPLIITILGLIYIFSPIDFLPEIFLGPIGLADDVLVAIIIIFSWFIYFSAPLIEMLFNVILIAGVIFGLIYLANILYKKAYHKKGGKRKISLVK